MITKLFKKIIGGILRLRNFYYSLNLRLKFTLLIGFITLFVIISLSLSVLEAEKNILREKVEEICRVSVQNLTSVARDNLLTGKYTPIQDVINNMKKMKLDGFEYAFVVNRVDTIIAHSNPLRIMEFDSSLQNVLNTKQDLIVNYQKNQSEYLQLITQTRSSLEDTSSLVIGLAGVAFSHSIIQTAVNKATRAIFFITLGTIIVSVLLVQFVSKRLSKNIITLSDGVREIAKGNLDVNISINSKDEIGLLASEFNKMVTSLREKLQMQKFVSQLTVDMIQNQSSKNEKAEELFKKKEIAVLFTDIRGFTKLSEKLEPEQLVEIINVYLNMQSKFIEDNEGVIDKFAGDEVMAIFQNEDAVDSAVKSAIAIQKKITEINRIRRKSDQEYLTVGIGINFGTAMIGSMGAASRMDYTAIGDVVNLASKLCNFARAGHIIVTKNVIKYLNGAFSVIKMEPVLLSGRRRPIQIYRVVYN